MQQPNEPDAGNNLLRFFLALILLLVGIVALVVIFVLLSPLILAGSLLLIILAGLLGTVILIVGIGAFLWYLSRKEPEDESSSQDYSIDQGKDATSEKK